MCGGSGASGVLAPDLTLGGPCRVHHPLSGSLWAALERDDALWFDKTASNAGGGKAVGPAVVGQDRSGSASSHVTRVRRATCSGWRGSGPS
jgi:hypothetical protein